MALKSRKVLFVALGILVAGYLLFHFRGSLHLNQISGAKLWEAVRRANFVYLFLSIIGIYGCYALRALRWQKFQSHLGPSKFWNIYRMTLAGFSAQFLLGRAAEPVRPLLISRKDKIPLSDIFGIYALERILDVASNLLGFVRGVQTVRSWGDVAAAVIYSALHWLLVVCVYLLVFQSFGGKLAALRFPDAVLILVFSLVGSAVQLPVAGGGAQALSVVAFTQLYGVEREPAVAAAMILWLVTFASCSFAGVPLLLREGWSLGELKRMREHEGEQLEAELVSQAAPKHL